ERHEEVELRVEVVEDRAAREADLRLEPGDRRAPPELRPKVMTAMITLSTCAGPLGYIVAGQVLAHASVYLVFFVIAAALTASAIPFSLALLRGRAPPDVAAVPDV